jgi:dihydroneopterin aldolase
MTVMLATVGTIADARVALAQGADIVELLDAATDDLRALAGERGAARLCAIAAGGDGAAAAAHALELAEAGADCVKLRLPPSLHSAAFIAAAAAAAQRATLFGVLAAERIGDPDVLDALAAADFAGAVIEPADAAERSLLERASLADLRRFVAACRARDLASGLSGALEPPDVPRLLALEPDILGFRRALYGPDRRREGVDPQAVALLRGLIPAETASAPAAADQPTDRVFVRDLVVDMRVGVYARERERRQPVRFTVEVDVARPRGRRAEFRDVFSYDVITDRIRMMAEAEHHGLVETIAEKVAEAALAHPRAMRVMVRVEKLAVVAGSVGVEIVRTRG